MSLINGTKSFLFFNPPKNILALPLCLGRCVRVPVCQKKIKGRQKDKKRAVCLSGFPQFSSNASAAAKHHHCMLHCSGELSTIWCLSLHVFRMWPDKVNLWHRSISLITMLPWKEPQLDRKNKFVIKCKCLCQRVTQLSVCCTGVNPGSSEELILHTGVEQITHFAHQKKK